jgi:hypothetical protein
MECKHGTHEPCDLCAEEDAEHDREMAIQARIDAARADERERCAVLVESRAGPLRTGAYDALIAAAAAIRASEGR